MGVDHDLLEAAAWLKAAESRNDPDYISDLEEKARSVEEIANSVTSVILYRDGKRNRVEVGLARPSRPAEARAVACGLGALLEAPVRVIDTPQAGESPPLTQKQFAGEPAYKYFKGAV